MDENVKHTLIAFIAFGVIVIIVLALILLPKACEFYGW